MGNRISAIHGARSPNFFAPGNAVNQIWFDDVEIVSRMPFGDSDMGQAAWPKNDYPKIPWHPFVIPLRAAATKAANVLSPNSSPPPPPSSSSSSSILRRSLAPIIPSDDMLGARNNNSTVVQCCILLILAIPFLIAPAVIYHSRRADCNSYVHPASLRVGARKHYCAKRRCHATVAHALLAQALGDAGLSLLYASLLATNDGAFRVVGESSKVPLSIQLGAQLVALVSRIYLVCMWYQYLRAHWFPHEDANSGKVPAGESDLKPALEKLDLSIADVGSDVESSRETSYPEKRSIV